MNDDPAHRPKPPSTSRPAAQSTQLAYTADWKHFTRWCRLQGASPLPPSPELVGLYLANLASPPDTSPALSASTIDRRLSGLVWNYAQRGTSLDRQDSHITTVLTRIKRTHTRPPVQKQAIRLDDILAMAATLPFDLRGLRDRAILLLGHACALGRSEIVSLDIGHSTIPGSSGQIEILDDGAVLTLKTRTGWRKVEIGRGSTDQTCPVHAVEQWLHFAKIDHGPIFVRTSRDGKQALDQRLNSKHVARLIKSTVLNSGIRADLPEAERLALYSGHSLRKGMLVSDQDVRSGASRKSA
ncbi:hypothetical protein GCM10007385_39810 [Tateyamaria omphalii]|uniref:integrase n=1 Tax=Tateyamaria omphalii TaxID=299262 RepID=UPI001990C613|nr:integrase [Tateyamaria omphalii]GGX66787.1 hypothetical protein GCM10007385_39810 [Tateyamaria omphalii]